MGTENAARNAARVACVEYTDVSQNPSVKLPDVDVSSDYQKEYTLDEIGAVDDYNNQILTDEENDILSEVKNTLPPSVTDVKVYIKYTYDETYLKSNATSYDVKTALTGMLSLQLPVLIMRLLLWLTGRLSLTVCWWE